MANPCKLSVDNEPHGDSPKASPYKPYRVTCNLLNELANDFSFEVETCPIKENTRNTNRDKQEEE
jgi:hypothetical protein